ncbi:unnamed protein product [Arctia plantaginis]|uniref:Uncharacterized protein n=1 Tax=Arctia plantaginis TaxID=874455 RepID=A0A8S0YVV0_ARCPL|nr:unnamed protein product [Arctia plantaginis]
MVTCAVSGCNASKKENPQNLSFHIFPQNADIRGKCLGLGVEIGLLCGVGFDVLLLLYYNSRPPLDIKHVTDGILPPHYAIHPVGRLSFAGAERVRTKILNLQFPEEHEVPSSDGATSKTKPAKLLVVYCENLYRLDYTFLQSLKMLESDWRPHSKIIFCNARPSVKEQLKGVLTDSIYCDSGELRTHLISAPVMPAAVEVGKSENATV